jgi:hypothetical protein
MYVTAENKIKKIIADQRMLSNSMEITEYIWNPFVGFYLKTAYQPETTQTIYRYNKHFASLEREIKKPTLGVRSYRTSEKM